MKAQKNYSYDNLKESDKKIIDTMLELRDNVLNVDTVEDYANLKYGNLRETRLIVREQLIGFVDYLRQQVMYQACDNIINCIDNYSEQDKEAIFIRNAINKGE